MEGKETANKLNLSLVPPEILTAVASIREYGCRKYSDPNNWKGVPADLFWQAILRHINAAWDDWKKLDSESGMPHLWHIACNISFLCYLLENEQELSVAKKEPEIVEPEEPTKRKQKAGDKKNSVSKKNGARPKIDIPKVLELRAQGLNNIQIGEYFGVKPQSISAALYVHKKAEERQKEELPN